MGSVELQQQINLIKANIAELGELAIALQGHPLLRGKILVRIIEQSDRVFILQNTLTD
jgi:hypothetical protein